MLESENIMSEPENITISKVAIFLPDADLYSQYIGGAQVCQYSLINHICANKTRFVYRFFTYGGVDKFAKNYPNDLRSVTTWLNYKKAASFAVIKTWNPDVIFMTNGGIYSKGLNDDKYSTWRNFIFDLGIPVVVAVYAEEEASLFPVFKYDMDQIKGLIFSEPGIFQNRSRSFGFLPEGRGIKCTDLKVLPVNKSLLIDPRSRQIDKIISFTSRPYDNLGSLKNLFNLKDIDKDNYFQYVINGVLDGNDKIQGTFYRRGDMPKILEEYAKCGNVQYKRSYLPRDVNNILKLSMFTWCLGTQPIKKPNFYGKRLENVAVEAILRGVLPVLPDDSTREEFQNLENALIFNANELRNNNIDYIKQVFLIMTQLSKDREFYNKLVLRNQETLIDILDADKNFTKLEDFLESVVN